MTAGFPWTLLRASIPPRPAQRRMPRRAPADRPFSCGGRRAFPRRAERVRAGRVNRLHPIRDGSESTEAALSACMRFTGHKTIPAFDGGCRGSALAAPSVSQFRPGQDLTTLKALLAEFVAFMLIDEPSANSLAAPVRTNREPPPNGPTGPTRPPGAGTPARTADEFSTWEHLLCTVLRRPRKRVNSNEASLRSFVDHRASNDSLETEGNAQITPACDNAAISSLVRPSSSP